MPGGSVPEGTTTWPWHRASNAVIDSLTHKDKGEPYEANHSLARSPDRLFLAGLALGRRRLRWRWHDDAASGHDSGLYCNFDSCCHRREAIRSCCIKQWHCLRLADGGWQPRVSYWRASILSIERHPAIVLREPSSRRASGL